MASRSISSSLTNLPFLRPSALPRPSTIAQFQVRHLTKAPRAVPRTPRTSPFSPVKAAPKPVQIKPLPRPLLPYEVLRTPSQQLPIYSELKRGGNLKQTRIKKINGDLQALRKELQLVLGLEEKEVVINQLTRHILIKGHRKADIEKFLTERQF